MWPDEALGGVITPTSNAQTRSASYSSTKIVCTLGPATATEDAVRGLVEAGMNVARINFSHGTHEQHVETVARVRAVADSMQRPIAILGDLQGPRIRIGELSQSFELAEGSDIVLVPEAHAHGGEIPVTYDDLAADVTDGDCILIDALQASFP